MRKLPFVVFISVAVIKSILIVPQILDLLSAIKAFSVGSALHDFFNNIKKDLVLLGLINFNMIKFSTNFFSSFELEAEFFDS